MTGALIPSTTLLHSSLQKGLLLHRSGDLEAAEQHYHEALASAPDDPEAMLLLGVVAREQQRADDAVAWTRRAVVSRPERAHFRLNLGLAYLAQTDLDEAERCFQEAISLEPDSALGWCRMAEVAARRQQPGRVITCYGRALALDPQCWRHYLATARLHRAQGLQERAAEVLDTATRAFPFDPDLLLAAAEEAMALGQPERASGYCARAARRAPESAEIRLTWADALRRQGNSVPAVVQYEHAFRLLPNDPRILHGLGLTCFQLGRHEDAVRCFRSALHFRAEDAALWHGLGRTYLEMRRLDEALPCIQRAVELDPDKASYWNTLGNVLLSRQPEEAERCYRAALERRPDFPEANVNLGITLMLRGSPEETILYYQRALELEPDLAGARYNLSLAYLRAGHYAEAWELYEARWRFSELRLQQRHASTPLWNGEPIAGQTILLHAEQGLGDSIQFLRYASLVAALGARVLLEVPASLERIARSLQGLEHVFVRGEALPAFDWQCPLMSLPRAFKTTVESIPQCLPYLFADPNDVQRAWQAFPGDGFRIGIVWAGNPTFRNDRNRSMLLDQLLPLAQIPGVCLFSLQKGKGSEQLEELQQLKKLPVGASVVDAGSSFEDFEDTAALMTTLDLVISVDTSCAHLAGALGKKVWILLPYLSDWRWLEHDEQSVWYATARLFRQPNPGNWNAVVTSVVQALQAEICE